MTCIRAAHHSVPKIQDPDPCRNKHLRVISLAERIICLEHDFCGRKPRFSKVLDLGLSSHHEERCRKAFSGNICNDHRKLVSAYKEKVVKIAANQPGRIHGSI